MTSILRPICFPGTPAAARGAVALLGGREPREQNVAGGSVPEVGARYDAAVDMGTSPCKAPTSILNLESTRIGGPFNL